MKQYESVAIAEEAHIGLAKRFVRRRAIEIGFNDRQLAEIEITVKELGSNAVKFARGTGQLYFTGTDERFEPPGIEIICVDKGPGIEDTALAIEDGYTTTGSMGAGLGAIRRMSDEFYIFSTVQSQSRKLTLYSRTTHGTAIVIRKYVKPDDRPPGARRAILGIFTRPRAGESINGDAYVVKRVEDRLVVGVIDGLGHGTGAMEASRAAVASIEEKAPESVEAIIKATHEALRPTRGAVAGVAAIDCLTGAIEYAGIGNTDFRVIGGGDSLRFISLNGTLGSRLDRVKVFTGKLPKVATVVMTTDGISERWDADHYPGLVGLHPQLLCAVVMRDYSRPGDDATVLCGRLSF